MARRSTPTSSINANLKKDRKSTQRERLLAGMTATASRDGYARANVSAVIAHAGVSRPTFYDYFTDKDECFLAALIDAQEQLLIDIEAAVEDQAPQQATQAAIAALLRFAVSRPTMARLLSTVAMAGGPRALDARDQGIADIEQIIERAYRQLPREDAIPDISSRMLIGAVQRLLSSRLRRGESGLAGMLDDLIRWINSYEQPAGEHRWRSMEPAPAPAHSPVLPPLLAPTPLPPGRPRLSREEVAANHRQRILFAAVTAFASKGYAAATIAEITKLAGVDSRAFYRLFRDKEDMFMALHELHFQHVMALTASAFFTGESWPERTWEAARTFAQYMEENHTLTRVTFIEGPAGGPISVQRFDDYLAAFTVFLQEGYRYEPQGDPPSKLALEAIAATNFEIVYHQARQSAKPRISGLLPHVTHLTLAPFLGPVAANRFIDEKLRVSY